MAWIDEVNELEDWLKNSPGDVNRYVRARLFALISTGLGFYAEGGLDLESGMIAGKVKRYETKDRWDFKDEPGLFQIFDDLPFDPTKLEDIPASINTTTGAIKVGGATFPQPETVFGSFLVSAKSNSAGFAGPWLMALSLHRQEIAIPQ